MLEVQSHARAVSQQQRCVVGSHQVARLAGISAPIVSRARVASKLMERAQVCLPCRVLPERDGGLTQKVVILDVCCSLRIPALAAQ